MEFTVAVSGDAIITRRISTCVDERFTSVIDLFKNADVGYTHLEVLMHDYDGPEVYPAAQAGFTWMRAPMFVAEELKWAGFDIVSTAHNHSLDYSYGGLLSTWKSLNDVGIPHTGTGKNLSEARDAAYLDTAKGRVALVSMTSSFNSWTRAGEQRRDVKGRPGVNPLRYHYRADKKHMDMVKDLFTKMGWWVTQVDDEVLLNAAGIHNTLYKFIESDQDGIELVADEDDVKGNLLAIKEAKTKSDFVIVHIHNHEWDPAKRDVGAPPEYISKFARECIDAGADIFIAEGSHAYLRGIEIYNGKPIFYDPGDIFRTHESITRLPSDYYWRYGFNPDVRRWDATPTEAFKARKEMPSPINPIGGYRTARVLGIVIPVCTFDQDMNLKEIKIYPANLLSDKETHIKGLPGMAKGEEAREIIEYLDEISEPFGTKIDYIDGIGVIKL